MGQQILFAVVLCNKSTEIISISILNFFLHKPTLIGQSAGCKESHVIPTSRIKMFEDSTSVIWIIYFPKIFTCLLAREEQNLPAW